MFTKLPVFAIFLLLIEHACFGQQAACAVSTFQKTYGKNTRDDLTTDIVETPDRGFITGGWGADNGDCFLMKVNHKGDMVWVRQIADNAGVRGFMKRFIRLSDGNYLAVGRAYRPDLLDTWIIKFDESGNIIWNKELTYPTGRANDPLNVCETADGGLAICGTYAPYANAAGSFVVKLNAAGMMVWSKSHLGDFSLSGITEKNGSLLLVGRSSTNYDGIIIKLKTADGTVLGGNTIHVDNKHTAFHSIQEKNDRYYINGYNTNNASFDGLKQFILILDTNMNILKAHKFNLDFQEEWAIPAMLVTNDGGFIAVECDDRNPDLLLFKVSYDGVMQWKRRYPKTGEQRPWNAKLASDNGIIGIGTSFNGQNDAYIFKTDSLGLSAGCPVTDLNASISNPPYTNYSTPYVFAPIAFPIIDISSINTPVTIPLITFCESVNMPLCGSLELLGEDSVCNFSEIFVYKAIRNIGCATPVLWNIDPALATIISTTDSTVNIKFKQVGPVSVIASLPNLCQPVSDTIVVAVFLGGQSLNLGPDKELCPGNTITLNARKGFVSYEWQDQSTDSTYTVTQPGIYHVTTIDACGGVFKDSVTVTAAPPIAFSAGPDRTKCNNDTLHLSAPSGFLNYAWSNNYNINSITAQNVVVNPLIDTAYYIKAEKIPGCFAYDTVRVTVHTSQPIDLGTDKSFCFGDSATFNAGSGFSNYSWSSGQPSQLVVVKNAGQYSVIGTTAEGCKSYDTVKVLNVFSLPVVQLDKNPGLCVGESRTLDAGSFSSYLWNTGANSQNIAVNTIGKYVVIVTDGDGCKGSDSTFITTVYPLASRFLPADTAICSYGSLQLKSAISFNQYLWSTGSRNSTLIISQPGIYWLEVVDNNSCKGRDSVIVNPKQCLTGFYVPTAFTPNGDTKNDVFQPQLFGNVKQYRLAIYNRWGQLIFQTTEHFRAWDGKQRGIVQQTGVFVWTCTYQFEGEAQKTEKGIVTLIR